MPDIPDSQGATLTFNGVALGQLKKFSASFAVGNVSEVTNMRSPVLGQGQNARVLKQYNCTSIEPGVYQASFLGTPDLARNDVGGPGYVSFSWPYGTLTAGAFVSDLQAEFSVGELIQWSATFQITGFDS